MKAAARPRRLRALHRPAQIEVEVAGETLAAVHLGRRIAVEETLETWRIDDEWWRSQPLSREYRRVLLEDGRTVDVFRDLATGRWFRQAYG
jgi:hypothetical protein